MSSKKKKKEEKKRDKGKAHGNGRIDGTASTILRRLRIERDIACVAGCSKSIIFLAI